MHRGYVKLWRKIEDSAIWGNPELMAVWLWCLVKATHRPRHVVIVTGRGKTSIEIQPGQFVYGRKVASVELRMPPSSVRRRMARLTEIGCITQKADTHYTVVTVCNWESYNGDENGSGQPKDNQRTGKGQATDTDKNVKHRRKKDTHAPDFLFDVFWLEFPTGRKKSKGAARDAWDKAVKIAAPALLIERAKAYAASEEGRGPYVKMPSTWLNQQCWDDCDSAWNRKDEGNGDCQPTNRKYLE